jgi:hypothetical protein
VGSADLGAGQARSIKLEGRSAGCHPVGAVEQGQAAADLEQHRRPDNDVLFNGNLRQGEERRADEPRMSLVVSDGSAVDVYINGKLQKKTAPGKKGIYTIVKS